MNAAVAESRLRRIAVARRDEIDKRSYPSVAHKVGAFFAAVDPKIPTDWVQQVILDPRASSIGPSGTSTPWATPTTSSTP